MKDSEQQGNGDDRRPNNIRGQILSDKDYVRKRERRALGESQRKETYGNK